MSARNALSVAASVLTLAVVAACNVSTAPTPARLEFETHAAFFSREMSQNPPLDPQVFVRDASAPAAVGPQGISHVAGFRNALIGDPPATAIFTATGAALSGFTLGSWLGARGTVTIVRTGIGATVTVDMTGLRPTGVYSLFENHFDQTPVGFTPLDGTGTTNTFVADALGHAKVTVMVPHVPTHDNAVLLVYHSDGLSHGMERGPIGVTAHHQLIVRIPK